jgi:hypothetical protein
MGLVIADIKTALDTVAVPGLAGLFRNIRFGVGLFEDYPVEPYGWHSSRVFDLVVRMTDAIPDVQAGIRSLTASTGGDTPKGQVPALWAVATGSGLGSYLSDQDACSSGEYGYPCFGTWTDPIIVLFTDAPFHNGPGGTNAYSSSTLGGHVPPTYDEALAELLAIHARVVTLNYGDSSSGIDCRSLSTDTYTLDGAGAPMYYEIGSDGVVAGTIVRDAVAELVEEGSVDVMVRVRDDEADSVDATMFIRSVEPNVTGGVADPIDPALICVGGLSTDDASGDTIPDMFADVPAGTVVCFDVFIEDNTTIPPLDEPQVFLAIIEVTSEGTSVLDEKEVSFMVPPLID